MFEHWYQLYKCPENNYSVLLKMNWWTIRQNMQSRFLPVCFSSSLPASAQKCLCSAGYALSWVIHRIQSEIIFRVNPNLYTEWFGTVVLGSVSGLSFGHKKLPPPKKKLISCGNGNQKIWPYRLFTWMHGWRTVNQNPRAPILSFRLFRISSEKKPSSRFWVA
jgi:hypothetical protein